MFEGKASQEQDSKIIHGMICAVINKKGQLLILKRAPDKKFFPGKWAPVGAAPLTGKENMREIAERELVDELGVTGKILKEEKPTLLNAEGLNWIIYPFLAQIDTDKVTLNEEHTEAKWVSLEELGNYDTIPQLKEMVETFLKK